MREFERRWRTGETVEDESAYLSERLRHGDLPRERLELAALGGHAAARLVLGMPVGGRLDLETLVSDAAARDEGSLRMALATTALEGVLARTEAFTGQDVGARRIALRRALGTGEVLGTLAPLAGSGMVEVDEALVVGRACVDALAAGSTAGLHEAVLVVSGWLRNPEVLPSFLGAALIEQALDRPTRVPVPMKVLKRKRTKTLNDASFATDPGELTLSLPRLGRLCPELFERHGVFSRIWRGLTRRFAYTREDQAQWKTAIHEQLMHGDSRAAVVVALEPCVVAAYTDELDCVVLLNVPEYVPGLAALSVGDRMLTVNTYTITVDPGSGSAAAPEEVARDLWNGPLSFARYANFRPFLADLLCDDERRIRARKREIPEAEWARCNALVELLLSRRQRPRSARADLADWPAEPLTVSREELDRTYRALEP